MLIKDAAAAYQPEYLVITLGVNGVSFMDEASFKDCYTKLIQNVQAASPNTKIICNSIYPNMTSYKYYGDINNENITRANGWIQEVAAATGTRYSDTCSVLKDGNGALRADYCKRRRHPSQRGRLHRRAQLPAYPRIPVNERKGGPHKAARIQKGVAQFEKSASPSYSRSRCASRRSPPAAPTARPPTRASTRWLRP